ncbi:ribosome small subunit-dependent GTPase A [Streptomyces sp. SM12]|uniref:ribosome small subunit-dependent GTPase A n=1 Tax=unclassified Streptomyces TaxID=2593676 RepID=UPI000CD5B158
MKHARTTRPTSTPGAPGSAAPRQDTSGASPDADETAPGTVPTTTLAALGWDIGLAEAFAAHAATDPAPLPGRVVRVDRGSCDVATALGTLRAATDAVARAADPVEHPCTGDWAVLGRDAGGWAVRSLLPRRSAFLRSASTSAVRAQVLAANVDLALIAVSLAAEFVPARLERFVGLAWAGGVQPVVVLTKCDLADDVDHVRADAEDAAPGVRVLAVSSHTGEGVAELSSLLAGATSVLLGVSGAGKSTLANLLTGVSGQQVREVRRGDGRGRHTTTTRDLLALPGGGVLIDTPGLRGVGLWDAAEGVSRTFADIEALTERCRFGDCGHLSEPGCAVLEALDDGSLQQRRLESYRKLLRENSRIAARADARLRADALKEWKRRSAVGRHQAEMKRGERTRGGGSHRRR